MAGSFGRVRFSLSVTHTDVKKNHNNELHSNSTATFLSVCGVFVSVSIWGGAGSRHAPVYIVILKERMLWALNVNVCDDISSVCVRRNDEEKTDDCTESAACR